MIIACVNVLYCGIIQEELYCFIPDTLTVTPPDHNATVLVRDDARFYFNMRPWPTPCPPCRPQYEHITLEFASHSYGDREVYCQLHYTNGTFNNDSKYRTGVTLAGASVQDRGYTGWG